MTLVRYEDLQKEPAAHFARVLEAVGETEISQPHLEAALQFSQFGNMKKLEAAGAFDSKILQTRDQKDPESANVRRGKSADTAITSRRRTRPTRRKRCAPSTRTSVIRRSAGERGAAHKQSRLDGGGRSGDSLRR